MYSPRKVYDPKVAVTSPSIVNNFPNKVTENPCESALTLPKICSTAQSLEVHLPGIGAFEKGPSIRRTVKVKRSTTIAASICKTCGHSAPQQTDIRVRNIVMLGLAFVIYVSVGAIVFKTLESGPERNRKEELEDYINYYIERHKCVNYSGIIDLMVKAVKDSEIVFYLSHSEHDMNRWDFSGSFGFVVSVVTTIGFGNLAPFTTAGKVICVFYSTFGIPLTLLILRAIGQKMAFTYIRFRRKRLSMCSVCPKIRTRINTFLIAITGFITMFVAPAALISYVEDWQYFESFYFCFTTLSTIGFGDYVLGIHETKITQSWLHSMYTIMGYVWILLGLSFVSLIYRVIMDLTIAGAKAIGQKTKVFVCACVSKMRGFYWSSPTEVDEEDSTVPSSVHTVETGDVDHIRPRYIEDIIKDSLHKETRNSVVLKMS